MKQAKWLTVVTLVVLSGMASAQLSSTAKIVTDVPFEFVVANRTIPAGQCAVQSATMDGRTLLMRNEGASMNLFFNSSRSEAKQPASNYALVFNRYGNRYFLSGIKLQGSKILYRLPESKAEAELRAQNVTATEETVLASLK